MSDASKDELSNQDFVSLPAPTAWPLAVGVSISVMSAGVFMNPVFGLIGLILLLVSVGGWIAQLAPGKGHISVPLAPASQRPATVPRSTRTISQSRTGLPSHRDRFPEEIHPYSAAAKGGLIAGAAMALLAVGHGLVMGRGLFFNMNLLSAIILRRFNDGNIEMLQQFDLTAAIVALGIHFAASASIGLIYGLILPMFPVSPFYWAGLIAPLLWSGMMYGLMGVINPVMNQHIDWPWFVVCQFAFGLVLGWYIGQSEKIKSWGNLHKPREQG
ncbi:MAG: hypothetical protein ACK5Q5_07840 [Planctomycetaceae bacterium]